MILPQCHLSSFPISVQFDFFLRGKHDTNGRGMRATKHTAVGVIMPSLLVLKGKFAALKGKLVSKREGVHADNSAKIDRPPAHRQQLPPAEQQGAADWSGNTPHLQALKQKRSVTSQIKSTFSRLTGLRNKKKEGVTYSSRRERPAAVTRDGARQDSANGASNDCAGGAPLAAAAVPTPKRVRIEAPADKVSRLSRSCSECHRWC